MVAWGHEKELTTKQYEKTFDGVIEIYDDCGGQNSLNSMLKMGVFYCT